MGLLVSGLFPYPAIAMISFRGHAPLVILAIGLFVCAPAHAQQSDDLGSALQSIGQQYAGNYAQPVTDALGANLNAGLFRTADFGGTGLVPVVDIYVGVVAMGSFTAGSASSFRLSDEEIQTDDGRTLIIDYPDAALPTAFGNTGSPGTAALIDEQTGMTVEEVSLPGSLVDTPLAPLVVPQVGVGTFVGTDAQVRYLPETDVSDYGSVSFVGVAARHSVSQYIPLLPLDLAVQGSWQELTLSTTEQGKIVDASGWALNAQVSRGIPVLPVTFYGGVQYEKFDVEAGYTFNTRAGTSTITLDQSAGNRVRALAGVSISLAILRLNVDYAASSNDVVSAGVGVSL